MSALACPSLSHVPGSKHPKHRSLLVPRAFDVVDFLKNTACAHAVTERSCSKLKRGGKEQPGGQHISFSLALASAAASAVMTHHVI